MEVKELRKMSGLSQPQFSQKYNIPLPTLRHWEQGQRVCPEYVIELLEFKVREDLKKEMENMRMLESMEKIEIGMEMRFAELWDGNGDGNELLEAGSISPDNENVIAFKIIEPDENILNTVVRVTDIY